MKKALKLLSIFTLVFGLITPFVLEAKAEDPGYYYESIDIQVNVNEKREFEIVETLNVFYTESKHGIIRSIPESSSVESYWVRDVVVEGAPYTVEEYYDGKDIRIGDPDKTVTGAMTYVVKYTLEFYQDYDQSADFIYLNLIGNDFDTSINKLTASITYPENAIFEKCTVTEGDYGSRKNDKISIEHVGNTIHFESRNQINRYEAVTVQIQLNQGIFSGAPIYEYPYIIKDKEIKVEVTEEQDFIVSQRILIDANDPYTYYSLYLDMEAFYRVSDYDDILVQDFSGTVDGRKIDSEYSVSMDNPGEHEILLNYVLHPKKIVDGELNFELQNSYDDTQVENLRFEITLPKIDNYGVTFNRYNDELDKSRYSIEEVGNTLVFQSNSVLQAAEEAIIDVYVSKDDYYRPVPLLIQLSTALGGLFLAFVSYLKFGKYRNAPLADPVSFYPPTGVNSAEAGYLIDNRLSDEDVTSLIFQWASYGSLRIEGVEDEYTLVRISGLPGYTDHYERSFYESMFRHGVDGCVTEEDLKYYFYHDIESCRDAILHKYNYNVPISNPKAEKTGKICSAIAAIFPVIMLVAIGLSTNNELGSGFSMFISMVSLIPFIVTIVMFFVFKRLILSTGNFVMRILYIITVGIPLLMVLVACSFLVEVYTNYFLISIGICITTMLMASSIKQRSEEGTRLLSELRGFKKFIKTAEKDTLEMLLEENPEYYYSILPYAQTLKVTKIWQDKFEGIAMQPPSYYISSTPYSHQTFNRFYRDMNRTMKNSAVRPASTGSSSGGGSSSSSSGGGYSGGGGGFSSGGSSGGGSGGGGSRSW